MRHGHPGRFTVDDPSRGGGSRCGAKRIPHHCRARTADRQDGFVESDLQVAQRAVLTGAAVGLRHFAALADVPREFKADGSIVTAADRAVESAIRDVLGGARPADAVLGEEQGQSGEAANGGRRWIVDPIDGTAMFVAGEDRWLTLIALEENGRITVAVAAHPAQGSVWWATRGGGVFEGRIVAGQVAGGDRVQVAPGDSEAEVLNLAGGRAGVASADRG